VSVDVSADAEPPWAAAAVPTSSVAHDDRHTDRNQIVRQVTALLIVTLGWLVSLAFLLC